MPAHARALGRAAPMALLLLGAAAAAAAEQGLPPTPEQPARNRTLVYVHVGKSGGTVIDNALKNLCARGYVEQYVQLYTCRRQPESRTLRHSRCLYTKYGGSLVESNSSACAKVQSREPTPVLARSADPIALAVSTAPIVLWVRDPVARFASCWSAMVNIDRDSLQRSKQWKRAYELDYIFNKTLQNVQERSPALLAANLSLDVIRAADLEAWVLHCAGVTGSPWEALDALFANVPHALTGIAHYVGGLSGLERVRRQLLFVGTTEHFSVGWAELETALTRALGWEPLPQRRLPPEEHLHDSSSTRARRALSNSSVHLLREYFAEDLACIARITEWGLLPRAYAVEVGAEAQAARAGIEAGLRARAEYTRDKGQYAP